MEIKKNRITRNLLFISRHGERADHAGLIPKFHPYDAELTELGKMQAVKTGQNIKEFLMKKYQNKIYNVKLIASPFARTIQTSKKILNELKNHFCEENQSEENIQRFVNNDFNIEDKIAVDYYFSECRKTKDFKDPDFLSFLILLNKLDLLAGDLEQTKIEFRNKPEGIVEKGFEDIEDCFERVKAGLEKMYAGEFKNLSQEGNKILCENEKDAELNQEKVNVFIVVTHAEPLMQLNRALGYPGEIESNLVLYCDTFCYEIEHSVNPGFRVNYLEKLSLFEKLN